MSSSIATPSDVQRRLDYQYSTAVDGLLKEVYIPTLNNTIFHATPLLEMFGDFGGTIDYAGKRVIKAFKHQGAGGFGGISEGGDFVNGRKQKGFQGYEYLKYLNVYFDLTGPATKTVQAGQGAFVSAIQSAMDDTLKLARMNMERMVCGDGTGEVARFTPPTAYEGTALTTGQYLPKDSTAASDEYDSDTHTLTAISAAGGYTATQWLADGIRVYLTKYQDTNFGSSLIGPFEVCYVDQSAGTFSLKYVGTSTCDVTSLDGSGVYVSLVLESSYGEVETASGYTDKTCLEINGLANLVSDSGNVWNLDRSTYPGSLKSKVEAAGNAELDEELMMTWLLDMVNIHQSVPNVVVTTPKAKLTYFSNLRDDRRFNTFMINQNTGYGRLGITVDQYSMYLETAASLAPGTMYMLNTSDFKWAKATDGFQWLESGGQIIRQKEGSDVVFASAVNYCNLVCENPRGQTKITGINQDYTSS